VLRRFSWPAVRDTLLPCAKFHEQKRHQTAELSTSFFDPCTNELALMRNTQGRILSLHHFGNVRKLSFLLSFLKALPNETPSCRQLAQALGPERQSPPRVRRKPGTLAAAVDAPAAPVRWSAREGRARAPAATLVAARAAASAPPRLTSTLQSLARVASSLARVAPAPSERGGKPVSFFASSLRGRPRAAASAPSARCQLRGPFRRQTSPRRKQRRGAA